MPYTKENIQAFKVAKASQDSGVRATPSKSKRTGKALKSSSSFSFPLPDGKRCNSVFTYEHAIDPQTDRVYLGTVDSGVDAGEFKWTLANNDKLDQEVATMYLFRQISWEKQQIDQKLMVWNGSTLSLFKDATLKNATGRKKFTGSLNHVLKQRFDVSVGFTDGWDVVQLCQSVLSCMTVKRPTVASHQLVLERHEETLKTLLGVVFAQPSIDSLATKKQQEHEVARRQKEIDDYIKSLNTRLEGHDSDLTIVTEALENHEDILDVYELRLGTLEGRMDEHDEEFHVVHTLIENLRMEFEERLRLVEEGRVSQVPPVQPQVLPVLPPQPEPQNDPPNDAAAQPAPVPAAVVPLGFGKLLEEPLTQVENDLFAAAFDVGPYKDLVVNRIVGRDFHTLEPGVWLNDAVMNYFLELVMERAKKYGREVKCHFFNSHFLAQFTTRGFGPDDVNYSLVRRWTTPRKSSSKPSINIFEDFDLVFVPINKDGSHWALAVIDTKKREIKGYDSLSHPCRNYLKALRCYLDLEHKTKYDGRPLSRDWRCVDTMFDTNIPRQRNFDDCGIFVCMYMYYLSMGVPIYSDDTGLVFDQDTIYGTRPSRDFGRAKIGVSILKGEVL